MDCEQNIKEVLDTFLAKIELERRADPEYQDLFKKVQEHGRFLREMQHRMSKVVLDGCSAIKQDNNLNHVGNDIYSFFLALPLLTYILEKQIISQDGTSCCVDKVYYILSNMLKNMIINQQLESE